MSTSPPQKKRFDVVIVGDGGASTGFSQGLQGLRSSQKVCCSWQSVWSGHQGIPPSTAVTDEGRDLLGPYTRKVWCSR